LQRRRHNLTQPSHAQPVSQSFTLREANDAEPLISDPREALGAKEKVNLSIPNVTIQLMISTYFNGE